MKEVDYHLVAPAGWSIFTPFYDLIMKAWGFDYQYHQIIITLSGIKNSDCILDLGCGSGSLSTAIADYYSNCKITGIDPDPKILEMARKKSDKRSINFIQAVGENLPFADQSFDIAVSSLTFHHLPLFAKEKTISEVFRVLKKGGSFLVADFGIPQNLYWKTMLMSVGLFENYHYLKDNLEGKIPKLLETGKFKIQKIDTTYHGVEFIRATK